MSSFLDQRFEFVIPIFFLEILPFKFKVLAVEKVVLSGLRVFPHLQIGFSEFQKLRRKIFSQPSKTIQSQSVRNIKNIVRLRSNKLSYLFLLRFVEGQERIF